MGTLKLIVCSTIAFSFAPAIAEKGPGAGVSAGTLRREA